MDPDAPYTRAGSLDDGLKHLLDAAAAAPTSSELLADAVLDELIGDDARRDDIALLVIGLDAEPLRGGTDKAAEEIAAEGSVPSPRRPLSCAYVWLPRIRGIVVSCRIVRHTSTTSACRPKLAGM